MVFPRYLTDDTEIMEKIRTEIKNLLIVAGCGSGKTYGTLEALEGKKIIFAVPHTSVKEQLAKEYNLTSTGTASLKRLVQHGEERIVCCYESLNSVYGMGAIRDYVLILDEVHSIVTDSHFREKNLVIFDHLELFQRVIFLTATPDAVLKNEKVLGVEVEISEFKNNKKLNVEITEIRGKTDRISKEVLYQFINLERFKAVPSLYIATYKKHLDKIPDIEIISSGNRVGAYDSIINGILPEGLTFSTNLFNAGISIMNIGEINLIIDFEHYDINGFAFEQLIHRFRKASKINVYVINRNSTKQEKISRAELEDHIKEVVENLNNKEFNFTNCKIFNSHLKYGLFFKHGNFNFNFDKLNISGYLLNGCRNGTEAVIDHLVKKFNWKHNGIKYVDELVFEVKETEKKQKPKTILKTIMMEEGELNDFCRHYFQYRINPSEGNLRLLTGELLETYKQFNFLLKSKPEVKARVEDLVKEMKATTEKLSHILTRYFEVPNKYDKLELNPEVKEVLMVELLELGTDNTRFTKARKIIHEHIPEFNPNHKFMSNQNLKQLLKSIGVKSKRDGNNETLIEI